MDKIIKAAVDRGASDLHMKAGDMFRARINGELVALSKQELTRDQTRSIALHLMTNEDDKARLDEILGLPPVLASIAETERGMIPVTGVTGEEATAGRATAVTVDGMQSGALDFLTSS